jgi:hypothetical protein
MLVLIADGVGRDARQSLTILAVVWGVMLLSAFVWAGLYFAFAELRVAGGMVSRRNELRRLRDVPLEDVALVRLFSVSSGWSQRPMRAIVIVGKDRSTLMRVHGFFWTHEDAQNLAEKLGVPLVGVWQEVVTAEAAEDAHPGAATMVQRRPDLMFVLTLVGCVVVAAIVILAGRAG